MSVSNNNPGLRMALQGAHLAADRGRDVGKNDLIKMRYTDKSNSTLKYDVQVKKEGTKYEFTGSYNDGRDTKTFKFNFNQKDLNLKGGAHNMTEMVLGRFESGLLKAHTTVVENNKSFSSFSETLSKELGNKGFTVKLPEEKNGRLLSLISKHISKFFSINHSRGSSTGEDKIGRQSESIIQNPVASQWAKAESSRSPEKKNAIGANRNEKKSNAAVDKELEKMVSKNKNAFEDFGLLCAGGQKKIIDHEAYRAYEGNFDGLSDLQTAKIIRPLKAPDLEGALAIKNFIKLALSSENVDVKHSTLAKNFVSNMVETPAGDNALNKLGEKDQNAIAKLWEDIQMKESPRVFQEHAKELS